MKSITVKLDTKTIQVSKLPIGRYAEMLKAIKNLPQELANFDQLTPDVVIEKIPYLLGVALPDIINVVCVATELTPDEVEKFGLSEMTDVILAIFEVNNYAHVFDSVKKAIAHQSLTPTPDQAEAVAQTIAKSA